MLINIHTHHSQSGKANEFALFNTIVSKDYLNQFPCSAGIHLWYIDDDFERQFEALQLYQSKADVIAIGECGLDKLSSTTWERQVMAFERQIDLAVALSKPIIIHCVRSFSEVYGILKHKQVQVPVIFHGYAKNYELAASLLHAGYYISLGAQILKGTMNTLIQQIPLDRLFLETDDQPHKISDIYTYFCSARKINKQELEEQITQNFKKVFNYSI